MSDVTGPAAYSVTSRATRFVRPFQVASDAGAAALAGQAPAGPAEELPDPFCNQNPPTKIAPNYFSADGSISSAALPESPAHESPAHESPAASSPVVDSSIVTDQGAAGAGSVVALPAEWPQVDAAVMTTLDRPAPARQGFRGLLGTIGIRLSPGQAEQAERDALLQLLADEEAIRQTTWTRAISILVANRKGGVGKTPVSLMLAGTLAAVRGGSVCVLEVSEDPGALNFRAEGSPQLGLGQLVRNVSNITSAGQLAGYTAPQTSFASVIGSTGERARLTRSDVVALSAIVDEYYSICVMDSGNQTSSAAFEGALECADALVIPVLNSGDAVFEGLALLEKLRRAGGTSAGLADRAIIVRLTDGRPEHPQVMERINRIIAGSGVGGIFAVPYDGHIAERGQLTLAKLAPATYREFAAAAGHIVRSVELPVG